MGRGQQPLPSGCRKQTDDPDVVAATMAKPGVVLKRPVGSDGSFGEHAELLIDLGGGRGPVGARMKQPAFVRPQVSNRRAWRSTPRISGDGTSMSPQARIAEQSDLPKRRNFTARG